MPLSKPAAIRAVRGVVLINRAGNSYIVRGLSAPPHYTQSHKRAVRHASRLKAEIALQLMGHPTGAAKAAAWLANPYGNGTAAMIDAALDVIGP